MTRLDDAVDALRTNERQWQAFNVQGHCAVLAPPGSGKTRLLTTRLAYDLSGEIPDPRGAACITLTNAAADELLDRFQAISDDSRSNLFIGTVHSFALNRILAPFARLAQKPHLERPRVGHRRERAALWDQALEVAGVPVPDRRYLDSTVEKFRVLMAPDSDWDKLGQWPRRARDAYVRTMEERETYDFTYLIAAAVEIVESCAFVRRVLRAQFPRIYVDEYQDLAPGLNRIVKALALDPDDGEPAQLFAVGDPDQAIYGWTGSDPRLLTSLAARADVSTVRLNMNYRSGDRIIDVAGRLFDTGRNVVATRTGGRVSLRKVSGGLQGQFAECAGQIEKLVASGVPRSEIAIICRTNDQCDSAARTLLDAGIPCHVRARDSWETPLTLVVEELLAWAVARERSGLRPGDLLAKLRRAAPGLSAKEIAATLREVAIVDGRTDSTIALDGVLSRGLKSAAERLDGDGGIGLAALEWEVHSGYLSGSTAQVFADRRVVGDRAIATTMSACKGLEFDYVFIVDLEDGRVPFFTTFDKPDELAEERNKFYVALTRARHGASLMWSGFTETRFGPRAAPLSRFAQALRLEADA